MSLNKYHGDIHTVLRAREDRRIKKKRQEKAEIKEVNPPGESHSHMTKVLLLNESLIWIDKFSYK